MSTPYDVLVLAGGASRRMNGADKTRLVLGGRSLLDRALDATAGAQRVVVVGPERPTERRVAWVQEDPPGGGPAAAVAAGLTAVSAPVAVLLAGDLPLVTAATVDAVVAAVDGDGDGAVVVDDSGRQQWLCSAWRTDVLRRLPLTAGSALHRSLAPLTATRVLGAPGAADGWLDCDTPDDVRRAEALLP